MNPVPPRASLITHSAEHLRASLLRGEWPEALPPERSLCQRLGISRPTLRLVLAQLESEGLISPVKNRQRRVMAGDTILERAVKTCRVGLLTPVTPQQMPPLVLFWLDALRALLAESGYQLHVVHQPRCYFPSPASALQRAVAKQPADAWVLFRSTVEMQRWFLQKQPRALVAGSCGADVALPSVDVDYRAACRHASTLLRRKGHRRIALLLPEGHHGGDEESERGCRDVLQDDLILLRHTEWSKAVAQCITRALQSKPAPTAFIVARSLHALTTVTHLLQKGLQVPRDVAVVSRDGDDFLNHVSPRVTCYNTSPEAFAKRLSRLVLELAQTGRTSLKPVRLMPEFCIGESV